MWGPSTPCLEVRDLHIPHSRENQGFLSSNGEPLTCPTKATETLCTHTHLLAHKHSSTPFPFTCSHTQTCGLTYTYMCSYLTYSNIYIHMFIHSHSLTHIELHTHSNVYRFTHTLKPVLNNIHICILIHSNIYIQSPHTHLLSSIYMHTVTHSHVLTLIHTVTHTDSNIHRLIYSYMLIHTHPMNTHWYTYSVCKCGRTANHTQHHCLKSGPADSERGRLISRGHNCQGPVTTHTWLFTHIHTQHTFTHVHTPTLHSLT